MLQNFKYTLLSFLRNPALLFWPLAFPCVMAVLFNFMFANLDESYRLQPVAVGVVRNAAYNHAFGLDDTLRAVSQTASNADEHYLTITYFDDETTAIAAVHDAQIAGFITVDNDMPILHLQQSVLDEQSRLHLSAVTAVLDGYVRVRHELLLVAEEDPAFLLGTAENLQLTGFGVVSSDTLSDEVFRRLKSDTSAVDNASFIDRFTTTAISSERLQLTRTEPDGSARYFYALLGMAAGLGAGLALSAVRALQANFNALGVRRTMAGIARWRLLVTSLAAAWLAELACLLVGFLFMRYIIGVDFGNRTLPCLFAMLVSSFAFCGLGACAGTFAHMPETLVTALTILLSFFAGLYGTSSQRVADGIAATFPLLGYLNPVRATSQMFYALLYHDSLEPFLQLCVVLIAMGGAFLAVGALRMRRMRYAHL